jgi:hypothetical protein
MSEVSHLEIVISKETCLEKSRSEKSYEPLFKSKTRQESRGQRQAGAFRQVC